MKALKVFLVDLSLEFALLLLLFSLVVGVPKEVEYVRHLIDQEDK